MSQFNLKSNYVPTGDQPQAIEKLTAGLHEGHWQQVLLGATGTGKTFTIANVIAETQRPTLILAHNKTLAAQLYSEFKQFFPENAVSYYVSYYDYYQPEAYIPRTDTYIEKTTQINAEIERMRATATQSLSTRRDVIVVASVSAIYAMGDPVAYDRAKVALTVGETRQRNKVLRYLIAIQYERNDLDLAYGKFRVRGDVLEVQPTYSENAIRITFWGDEIEQISEINPLTGEIMANHETITIHPTKNFLPMEEQIEQGIESIEAELADYLAELNQKNLLLEAQRIQQRTNYDMEMLRELGYCQGIENYGIHFQPNRQSGESPWTLLDYFPDDFLLVIDESHMTIPQVRAMYRGDRSRKQTLVDYGFRLPSALDNRPITFDEFEERVYQVIHTTATPGPYENEHGEQVVQQIIRPTGLLDPEICVRPIKGQVDDLLFEVKRRIERGQRALITTLTKRMAEDLADYLQEMDLQVHYLHSDVDTFERVEILQDLRAGVYDAVVGINLLREGLDLPEVSLVAILDADKEGFLRSETALIQTIGRAARHVDGQVIMYADRVTNSMQRAIDETNRRRDVQQAYNEKHGIVPQTIMKEMVEMLPVVEGEEVGETAVSLNAGVSEPTPTYETIDQFAEIEQLEAEMKTAAAALEFERAAQLRDQIVSLRTQQRVEVVV